MLKEYFPSTKATLWVHVASLGEYEQGLPVLEALKRKHPEYNIALTFFSPSGYEVKKDKTPADLVVYLPMDTQRNAKQFLDLVQPKIAIFIKYEIWPNYLFQLKTRSIPTVLVSGIFSKRQGYFKWYGGFMRKALTTFTHFFVQEENSETLLRSIGLKNVTVSGDTRFDRVTEILRRDNALDFMERFKGNSKCLVAGSTWHEDEKVLVDFINRSHYQLKFVIAPHNIKSAHIESLKSSITRKVLLYSEITEKPDFDAEVILIDTVGLLTKIYSYADFAYVGGGFATGLHNTLEPAVFGIPVIIGPQYHKFNEAVEMVHKKGLLVVNDPNDFNQIMVRLVEDSGFADKTGQCNANYIKENTGATQTVVQHIETLL